MSIYGTYLMENKDYTLDSIEQLSNEINSLQESFLDELSGDFVLEDTSNIKERIKLLITKIKDFIQKVINKLKETSIKIIQKFKTNNKSSDDKFRVDVLEVSVQKGSSSIKPEFLVKTVDDMIDKFADYVKSELSDIQRFYSASDWDDNKFIEFYSEHIFCVSKANKNLIAVEGKDLDKYVSKMNQSMNKLLDECNNALNYFNKEFDKLSDDSNQEGLKRCMTAIGYVKKLVALIYDYNMKLASGTHAINSEPVDEKE